MTAVVWGELALAACAATFTPGPNNILLLSSASAHGFRRCRPLLLGIWTGLFTVMLVCGMGCAALGEIVPQIVPAAKYVGAAYVLYLAWKTCTRKTADGSTEVSKPLTYGNGFLLQFLNVKILMLGIAFYSGYLLPTGFLIGRTVLFAGLMTLCAGTGNLIWTTLGSLLFPLYRSHAKAVNGCMALLLVWCAWKMVRM